MHKQNTQSSPFKSAYIHTCINAEFSLYMPKHIHIYIKISERCLSRCWLQSLLNGESQSMQAAWQNTIKKRSLILAILKAGWSQRRQAPVMGEMRTFSLCGVFVHACAGTGQPQVWFLWSHLSCFLRQISLWLGAHPADQAACHSADLEL